MGTYFSIQLQQLQSVLERGDPFADLEGDIYLTLILKDDKASDLYTLDVKNGEVNKMHSNDFVEYTGKVSADGTKIA